MATVTLALPDLDSDTLHDLLTELSGKISISTIRDRLPSDHWPTELLTVGGAAHVIHLHSRPTTRDVDILMRRFESKYGRFLGDQAKAILQKLIADVAEEPRFADIGIHKTWMNWEVDGVHKMLARFVGLEGPHYMVIRIIIYL